MESGLKCSNSKRKKVKGIPLQMSLYMQEKEIILSDMRLWILHEKKKRQFKTI